MKRRKKKMEELLQKNKTKKKKKSGGNDVKEDEMKGRSKERRDHGNLFCLTQRQAVYKGEQVGD